jgi:hypothetical protein
LIGPSSSRFTGGHCPDTFDTYIAARRESLCQLVEAAIGKAVQRDIGQGFAEEDSSQFEPDELLQGTATEDD